jgi:hypothetical protein
MHLIVVLLHLSFLQYLTPIIIELALLAIVHMLHFRHIFLQYVHGSKFSESKPHLRWKHRTAQGKIDYSHNWIGNKVFAI